MKGQWQFGGLVLTPAFSLSTGYVVAATEISICSRRIPKAPSARLSNRSSLAVSQHQQKPIKPLRPPQPWSHYLWQPFRRVCSHVC